MAEKERPRCKDCYRGADVICPDCSDCYCAQCFIRTHGVESLCKTVQTLAKLLEREFKGIIRRERRGAPVMV